ncbi:MAG: PKD domain-containing protein [Nitrospira sp.]
MKKIIFFVTATLFFTNVAYADVSQFVFTTDPQNIAVDKLSDTITVQSQNSSGSSEDITETYDVVFTSTSQTGQFLSTSGNPVSTTMSKNTANKNFLYKDSNSGTHTITVKATSRSGSKTFTASQNIVVGTTENIPTSTDDNKTTTTSSTVDVSNDNTSAHSSPAPLSNTESKIDFEISAGRDRLTVVGNNISFQVVPTKLQNINKDTVYYEWSFGDGTTGQGSLVSHAYVFSGEYSVVVNAKSSDNQAVSRLLVKVISPDFSIKRVVGGVEIENKSKTEVNLEGWSLKGDTKTFVFPKDTLISAGKKVVFADEVTRVGGDVELLSVSGKQFGKTSTITPTKTHDDLSDIQIKIDEIKKEISKINPPTTSYKTEVVIPKVSNTEPASSGVDMSQNTDNTSVVFEATKKTNLVTTVLSWPTKSFYFVRHFFVED